MASRGAHPGDNGESSLLDGTRLPKDDPVFEALGAVDELGALLGVARAGLAADNAADARALRDIQRVLLKIGAQIASPPGSAACESIEGVSRDDLAGLDALEEGLRGRVEPPEGFVLPGGSLTEARIHAARASCRTAERRVVACRRSGAGHLETAQRYLNRLSGCLFWLALGYGRDL